MMKRRGIQILMMLVLICTLGISACKQDVGTPEDNAVTEPEEEDSEEEAEKEDFVIGFSAIDMENPYFITLESAAREALEAVGCQMITKDPGTDPDLQASQIQEMIDEGIDAILLTPVNWEKITPSLQALQEVVSRSSTWTPR